MDLSDDEFLPLTIKDEPSFDDSYGIMNDFTVTDINDEDIKIEVKDEPVDEAETLPIGKTQIPEPQTEKPEPPKNNSNAPKEKFKPRRTSRKSNNVLVSQNATSSIKRALLVRKTCSLDEISHMSGKSLVENFSEMSSNEMTKYFAYTCCLMPEICSNFFTSFGSEVDARNKMQKHIMQHVKDLLADKQQNKAFKFTAESNFDIPAEEAPTPKKRRRTNVGNKLTKDTSPNNNADTSTTDTITSTMDTITSTMDTATSTLNTATSTMNTATSTVNTATSTMNTATSTLNTATSTMNTATSTANTTKSLKSDAIKTPAITITKDLRVDLYRSISPTLVQFLRSEASKSVATKSPLSDKMIGSPVESDHENLTDLEIIDLNDIKIESLDAEDEEALDWMGTPLSSQSEESIPIPKRSYKRKREVDNNKTKECKVMAKRTRRKKYVDMYENHSFTSNYSGDTSDKEQFKITTVDLNKPWCLDHNYDVRHYNPLNVVNYKDPDFDDDIQYCHRPMPEFKAQAIANIEESKLPRIHFSLSSEESLIPTKLIIPILSVPASCLPKNLSELPNNIFENCDDIELPLTNKLRDSPERTNGLAKTSGHASVVKDMDFTVNATEEDIKNIEAMRGRWTHDHIRVLSKYYLKELEDSKGKNRRKKTLCGCKICPNKKFTAITTLYYHYISHTGEKPFKCSKCDKGFTRRHSLNYHSMTHNNTNRFKCPICLKQFRHTSHYKDHMKHHTGEEECLCKICDTSFKSKTAFNRHLKTKHNVIIGSNKASRVLSPSKINQLHLQQDSSLLSTAPHPIIIGTVESLGVLSTINSNGQVAHLEMFRPSKPVERSDNLDMLNNCDFIDPGPNVTVKTETVECGGSNLLPPNVILIQPEEYSANKSLMRSKPRILKARFGLKS